MPVAVAMLAAVIERKTPTLAEVAALTVLSAGVMLAVWEGSVTGSVTGVVLCVTALFSSAAMVSTTGKVRTRALRLGIRQYCAVPLQGAVPSFGVQLWGWATGWAAVLHVVANSCPGKVQQRSAEMHFWHCCPVLKVAQLLGQQSTAILKTLWLHSMDAQLFSETPTPAEVHVLLLSPLQVLVLPAAWSPPASHLSGCCRPSWSRVLGCPEGHRPLCPHTSCPAVAAGPV